jgi:hypothetical protein
MADILRKEEKALEVLSEPQKKRWQEIMLQGAVRCDGPAVLFHYRAVVDGLALENDQQRKLLEILQDDMRGYLRISVDELEEKLPDLDVVTAEKLESALTGEQRETLAGLLGEPAECIDEPGRPVRRQE